MHRTTVPSTHRGRRLIAGFAAIAALGASLALTAPARAQGDGTAVHTSIVSADPADFTPYVKDGIVESVVQVGNQIVIGGTFTQVVKGTTTYTRHGLAAFNATSGAVSTSFAPTLNGEVTSLEVSADGQSVYAAGAFNTVNGVTRKKVALVKLSDGSLVTAFKAKGVSARVADVRRVDGTLWIAGQFKKVQSQSRVALATLNATTGALTDESTLVFSGQHNEVTDPPNKGATNIREIAITPAGDKLLAIGNFTKVNGATRDQVAMINIGGSTATLSGWQTSFFAAKCNTRAFDTFMRDVAISPDGKYAVFATTGSYRADTSCDTVSRLEISGNSSGVTPTWVNMTGGDTTTAVAIVGSVVYTGGHFRWVNNPSAADKAGQGAIERTGLAALNPINGLPYDWNPTRERGYGVYDFLATDQGLWVGSDTDTLGNEYHPRIGLFPLAGGSTIPSDGVGAAPGDVFSVGPQGASGGVTITGINGSIAPGSTSNASTSDSWQNARGGMIVGGTLFTTSSDRGFYASSISASSVGARTPSNLNVGPTCTSSSGSCLNAFAVDAPSVTGMFYDAGRIYYTMSTSSSLYYRYFEPQGGIVGGTRYTASGGVSTLNPSRVRGMFLNAGQLYFADSATGNLLKISFNAGVVGSSISVVDSSRDWRAAGLALRGQGGGGSNQPPVAAFTASCTYLTCSFNSGSSSDPDGSISSRQWTFGDSSTGSGATVAHPYDAAGPYSVTLTVTDNSGATGSVTHSVTVSAAPASPIGLRGSDSASSNGGAAKVNVPSSVQAGDTLLLLVTLNGDSETPPPAGWTQIGEESDDLVTRVFRRTADGSEAGQQVSVAVAGSQKSATTLLAYSGVKTSGSLVLASAAEGGTTAAHQAPAVQVSDAGSWVVNYWADKTSGTTGWTVPVSLRVRELVLGSGGGQVGGVSADSFGPVPTGTRAAATATASTSGGKATSFSIVLPPA